MVNRDSGTGTAKALGFDWSAQFGALIKAVVLFVVASAVLYFLLNWILDEFITGGGKFNTSSDMIAVMGVVTTALGTIAGAAFGVSVGNEAGKAAGEKGEAKEKERVARIKNHVLGTISPPSGQGVQAQLDSADPEVSRMLTALYSVQDM